MVGVFVVFVVMFLQGYFVGTFRFGVKLIESCLCCSTRCCPDRKLPRRIRSPAEALHELELRSIMKSMEAPSRDDRVRSSVDDFFGL